MVSCFIISNFIDPSHYGPVPYSLALPLRYNLPRLGPKHSHHVSITVSMYFLIIFLQGIMLVYDITNEKTFLDLQKWVNYVQDVSSQLYFAVNQ